MEATRRQQTEARVAQLLAIGLDVSPAAAIGVYRADPVGVLSKAAEALRAISPQSATAGDCSDLLAELAAESMNASESSAVEG